MKKFNKTTLLFLLPLLLSVGCSALVITPVEMTNTAIGETLARIDIYAKQNHEVPRTLTTLPKRDHHINRITDGWNRQLIYTVENNVITLTSLGKDGVIGGIGENADISQSYYYKKPDGTLWVGQDLWLVEAKKH
jgi:hypothetical protein